MRGSAWLGLGLGLGWGWRQGRGLSRLSGEQSSAECLPDSETAQKDSAWSQDRETQSLPRIRGTATRGPFALLSLPPGPL